MGENIDLKELQRKAMSSFQEDGVIDIIIGLLGLIWGFSAFTDDSGLSVVWIAVVVPTYWWLKREYTIPRIGLVRFSGRRSESVPRAFAAGLVGAVVAVGFAFLWQSTLTTRPFYYYVITDYWGIILGMCIAVIGAFYARVYYLPRFYAYSALVLVFVGSAQYTGLPFGVHLIALGSAFLIYGGYLLHRFLGKYPAQAVDGQVG